MEKLDGEGHDGEGHEVYIVQCTSCHVVRLDMITG